MIQTKGNNISIVVR
jgi:hypothetical protein